MSFLSKLFGGGKTTEPVEPTLYKDFEIFVEPMKESDGYRIAARIEKGEGDARKSHHLIRADVCRSIDDANETSLAKAKQIIDQVGDGVFNS